MSGGAGPEAAVDPAARGGSDPAQPVEAQPPPRPRDHRERTIDELIRIITGTRVEPGRIRVLVPWR